MMNPAISELLSKIASFSSAFVSLLSVCVGFGLANWRDARRAARSAKNLAKTLQAEVFLTVVALRESRERANEVRSRRENGEIQLHSNHSHDIELNIFLANTSRIADLPSKISVLLLIFNRSVERQNGLSRLMDRKYEELVQREIGELRGLQVHYDEYIAEADRAIEYGSLLNQVFFEEYGDSGGIYLEETSEAGVVKFQIARKW